MFRKLDPFTPEKKAILDFFIRVTTFWAIIQLSHFVSHLVTSDGEPYEWGKSLIFGFCFFFLPMTIAYFVTRVICYRTKFLQSIENREGLHVFSCIILSILLIIATLAFA